MRSKRIVPLLIITFPEKIFYYSLLDINIKYLQFGPQCNSSDDDFIGTNFKPYLADEPVPALSFDVFNPKFTPVSVKIKLFNYDGIHNYTHKYGIGVPDILYIQQDIANQEEIFRMTGKMSEISFDRWTFEFTLKDESSSCFIDQPANVLKEDTFQTIKTIGPFDENPLRTFGLLVAVLPGPNAAITTAAGWPVAIAAADDDRFGQLVAWIEHPDLYNDKDDEYWVGSMVSIIQDPLDFNTDPPPCRSGINPLTGSSIANSPYSTAVFPALPTIANSWPHGSDIAPPPPWTLANINPDHALWKPFSLRASAYVLKCGNKNTASLPAGTNFNSNAMWNQTNKRGRIWFDVNGPEVDNTGTDAGMAVNATRRLPDLSSGAPNWLTRRFWNNRTPGSKAMGALCNRHIIRITRRPFPENIDSAGKAIPIAYGMIKRAPSVHAIGGKSIGDEGTGCSDHYIICGHPMCVRVCSDHTIPSENNIEQILQFREITINHSLDEMITREDKLLNPAANNVNETGPKSQNPFPRVAHNIYVWSTDIFGTGTHMNPSSELEPYVKWFNAGEDKDYRYRCYNNANTPTYSRQIKLVDNAGKDCYSGIRLRGEDYWSSISSIAMVPVDLPTREMVQNFESPQYPIRNGFGNSNLYFDFNGEPDFDDGCVTGIGQHSVLVGSGQVENIRNPAGLVQNPADIIAHFILKYTKINGDKGKIDWPSFRKSRGMLNGWRFSSFLDEVKKGEDIIGQWQSQCRSIIYYKNDKFYMRYIDLDPNREVKYVFNDGNIDRDSLSVEFNGVGEMYNKFTIQYAFDRPHKTWAKSIEYTSLNNTACRVAEQMYGATDAFTFECPDVLDSRVANMLTNYFVELYTKQRLTISLSAPINGDILNIEQGDLVIVQCDELPNRAKFERNNNMNISPPRLPFIVTNITPANSSYKYSLLQLWPRSTMI